ncbi:chemotaxis response regulator protein-glutamate methylesterase [Niveibacterium sp. 24ML]|uniref:protein-glutamate methylesterase/protein-glutamine glutaminase n=1 Tax=Niveibacterium sp. 24ML TaxID=2985512 RepID=UPI002271CD70|nr:chemotaxis response regulator protein-glutamate methylesterase [Niveibacterium sp. 24ML]MCX9158337.1 chemotaxis response regulator protein-glutamate methylesterase [Niveibacterium sp. 24ML]
MAIRVLVVDDSAVMRSVLSEIINQADDLEVVGTATDPIVARELIKQLNPDVVTLDIEMPKMDGLEFLDKLMRLRPTPVIMISTLTERGSDITFRALELGAVDFVTKPKLSGAQGMRPYAEEICDKIRAAYQARLRSPSKFAPAAGAPPSGTSTVGGTAGNGPAIDASTLRERLVLIGASTGGTEAIKEVLCRFPEQMPGILIVQHMPEMFTGSFAKRLDGLCKIRVKEAEDGEKVMPGTAYLAPGHSHLLVKRSGGLYVCELSKADPVNRHRPSVDVLFHSAAKHVGANGVGVILTGMGKDGAQGMLAMKKAGCWNIGQDQESCVVYGMPREAAQIGAIDEVSTLNDVALRVVTRLRQTGRRAG